MVWNYLPIIQHQLKSGNRWVISSHTLLAQIYDSELGYAWLRERIAACSPSVYFAAALYQLLSLEQTIVAIKMTETFNKMYFEMSSAGCQPLDSGFYMLIARISLPCASRVERKISVSIFVVVWISLWIENYVPSLPAWGSFNTHGNASYENLYTDQIWYMKKSLQAARMGVKSLYYPRFNPSPTGGMASISQTMIEMHFRE